MSGVDPPNPGRVIAWLILIAVMIVAGILAVVSGAKEQEDEEKPRKKGRHGAR